MILTQLRNYLKQQGEASLAQLLSHFDCDAEAMRGMLAVWLSRGLIECRAAAPGCGSGCKQCDPLLREVYVWVVGRPQGGAATWCQLTT